jgi:hypothetical protein
VILVGKIRAKGDTAMRDLTNDELQVVSGGRGHYVSKNVSKQSKSVSVVNSSVSVKQVVVQKNGVTLVDKEIVSS